MTDSTFDSDFSKTMTANRLISFIKSTLNSIFCTNLERIECRDVSTSRVERLTRMLRSYIPEEDLASLVHVETNDPSRTSNLKQLEPAYDRVLVDAPCTNDRSSLFNDKNNIFSKARSDERAAIPKLQTELLT
jgi:16S rRNA C967 or C1407 C5-methylase (RsmB/RsmF family)